MTRGRSIVLVVAVVSLARLAHAELLFDFEGPYLVDPGHTIKDHEMTFDGQRWHCIYIRGEQGVPGTATETQLDRATTTDLCRWDLREPVLEAGPDAWDSRNVWAPALLPTPWNPGQWTMLYTGADAMVVQRMGHCFTTDGTLEKFSKLEINPILEPDSTLYDWSSTQWFSSFRDPFYFYYGGQHHVLHTAGLRGPPRRGVVHHAVSSDLLHWTEVGVLVANNNDLLGTQWHDLESVQLIKHGANWYLFYTEQDLEGVRWIRSTQMDSGWDVSSAQVIDLEGIAAEVTPLTADDYLFTRHVAYAASDASPDSGEVFWTLRADTLRFHPGNGNPYLVQTDALADWPVRIGSAFVAAPTFGDNARERGASPVGLHGHGYLSTRDFYAGPASGLGQPGGDLGTVATGTMQSAPFTITPGSTNMSLLVGGGTNPACRVLLARASDDSLLFSATGQGSETMSPVIWDLNGLDGELVYLRVEDEATDSQGWISIDEVRMNQSLVAAPELGPSAGRLLANRPNPFNPRTVLRFELDRKQVAELLIHDTRGRLVQRRVLGPLPSGRHQAMWDGADLEGASVASGVYFVQLRGNGAVLDSQKITLIR